MTSVNSLVAGNVAIPIHARVSNTVVGIIDIAVRSIEKFTKLIVLPSIENHAALLTNELHLRQSIVKQNGNTNVAESQLPGLNHTVIEHPCYSFRTNPNPSTKLKNYLVFILAILLLVPIVCGKDVHVFPEVGAIAERCGDVAVQSSSAIFSMVLRLEIPTPRIRQWHCHNGLTHLEQFLHKNIDGTLLPTWAKDYYVSYPNVPNNYPIRTKRFMLPLISMVTGIGGLAAGIYNAIEIQSIKAAQAELRDHVQSLQRGLQEEHQEILEIAKNTKKNCMNILTHNF